MCIATDANKRVLATQARKCKTLPEDSAVHCSQLSNVARALHRGAPPSVTVFWLRRPCVGVGRDFTQTWRLDLAVRVRSTCCYAQDLPV